MKKVVFIVFFIVSFSQAQSVKIGVKAGLNYANLESSKVQTDAITSYHAGLVAELKILDSFSIQPELLYSTQGATYKNAVEEFKNELGYLSIPVVAQFNLNNQFSIELGPQASFLLSERKKFEPNDAETFDFSGVAGLRLKLTESIFINARYVLGLTEVSKDAESKNSIIQVSAGLYF
jgi:Outer membrane protein beta-barrel domain